MLIVRAPLRISLAGGGTDLPAYYEQHGGLVISTSIDKFVYVYVNPTGAESTRITSADYQIFYRHRQGTPMNWDGDLALPRAVLHEFGVDQALSLFLASEVPPGTGLGSSSAIAVALVQAVTTHLGRQLGRHAIAELACHIELGKLRAPIGKQDQFAAAYGGLNCFTFERGGVSVEPLGITDDLRERLDRRLLLFFTGTARNSATILQEQQRASAQGKSETLDGLHRIKELAHVCRRALEDGDLDGIGHLLDEHWRHKRRLASGISSARIDEMYAVAREAGALGGKITGAGGGGFLLLYCHEARQDDLTDALEARGLRRMDFRFDRYGVTRGTIAWQGEPTTQNGSLGQSTHDVMRADWRG